ncbi:MAG: NUDIX domain-containing protein [Acidobacteriota bacterium]
MNEKGQIPEFGILKDGVDYELRPGGYVVLRNADGWIAVVQTPKGYFLPGGGQDAGESAESAAIREAAEECGLVVTTTEFIGIADELVWSALEGKHFRKRCSFFSGMFVGDCEPVEVDHELVWLSDQDARTFLTHQSQLWAIQTYLEKR